MKKILLYLFLAIVFLAVAGFAYAYKKLKQDIKIPPLTAIKTVADIVKPYIDNEMTKGLSIGTYQDGKIEFYNFGICAAEEFTPSDGNNAKLSKTNKKSQFNN